VFLPKRHIRGAGKYDIRLAALVVLLIADAMDGQELKRRTAEGHVCEPLHIHMTARTSDGAPVRGLSAKDLNVFFDGGSATIVSLQSGASNGTVRPETNVLFVVRPYSDLNGKTVNALIQRIKRADNFDIHAAVLARDGSISPFTQDPEELRAALNHAINRRHRQKSLREWAMAELDGFLAIRRLSGRHVIFDLTSPANPYHSAAMNRFMNDSTLDILATYDMAQIYRLVESVPLSTSIPMGDASTLHVDIGPENHAAAQVQQLQDASQRQSFLWLQKQPSINGGRNDESVEALFEDVLLDAPGSYDLMVQPEFGCRPNAFYRDTITSRRIGVHLFAPSVVQMMPTTSQSK
jgi:hypothetical protein